MATPSVLRRTLPDHPGWLARSLFWAAFVIATLPAMILMPMMSSGMPSMFAVFGIISLVASILRLTLGTVALLLVKNTTWTRRLIAGGLFLLSSIVFLVLSNLAPMLIDQMAGGLTQSNTAITVFQTVLSGLLLAAALVSWSIARNRRWWVLLIAFVYAVISGTILFFGSTAVASGSSYNSGLAILIQVLSLAAIFVGLGVLHLLGRIKGATVPVPVTQSFRPHQYAQQQYGQWNSAQNPGGQSMPPGGPGTH
jgi:hypothetical protein